MMPRPEASTRNAKDSFTAQRQKMSRNLLGSDYQIVCGLNFESESRGISCQSRDRRHQSLGNDQQSHLLCVWDFDEQTIKVKDLGKGAQFDEE